MGHPYIIRTKFPTIEEIADIYGMSKSRVNKLLRIITAEKKAPTRNGQDISRAKIVSRGVKRRDKKSIAKKSVFLNIPYDQIRGSVFSREMHLP